MQTIKTLGTTMLLATLSVVAVAENPHHFGGSRLIISGGIPHGHELPLSRLTGGRVAFADPHDLHSSHVVTPFNSRYQGSYCERNGHCFFQSSPTGRMDQIAFGGFSHVDDLAARLEFLSNELCLDLYYNYTHNRGFDVTYAEAYQILEVAEFIHSLEHQHMDRVAIRNRLNGLDALFHHVQDDVRGWSRVHRRQVGTLGIIAKMDLMEATLHHLMNDVGVNATAEVEHGLERAPAPRR